MKSLDRVVVRLMAFWLAFLVAGCTTQLAPRYDEVLYENLTTTNVQLMELFATVAEGTDPGTCEDRLGTYNSLIGSVDAMALQSAARPIPENAATEKVNAVLETRGVPAITGEGVPSAAALQEVSENLVKMKQVDCESGLRPFAVAAFKNAVVISMDQAITYESFLNR